LEKAQILHRLIQFGLHEDSIVKNHLSLLQIPGTLDHLEAYVKIAELEPETKSVIYSKTMAFSTVRLLIQTRVAERRLLLPLLQSLGQNKQRELLQNLLELSKRDGISIQNILEAEDAQKITEDQNLSSLQKADEIRNLIQRKRYPTFTAWENTFKSQKKDLDWPEDIKIEPSPFFEGETFTVQFAFKDLDEYRIKMAKLNQAATDGKISQLLTSASQKKSSPSKKDE
jgi:hypothetical protein